MAPTLLLLRRWSLPAGSLTLLFSTVAVLSAAMEGFHQGATVVGAVVAGVIADGLVQWLRPAPERLAALRAFAALVPVLLWSTYFALLAMAGDLGWPVELWAGVTCTAGLVGFGLALLVAPPPLPVEAVAGPDGRSASSGCRYRPADDGPIRLADPLRPGGVTPARTWR